MNREEKPVRSFGSRREFLKTSGTARRRDDPTRARLPPAVMPARTTRSRWPWSAAADAAPARPLNALEHQGPTKLWAMADVFDAPAAAQPSQALLEAVRASRWRCPRSGSSSAWTAIRRPSTPIGPGGVVLLATPPAFRPMHLEYAVSKGCHVFMEKSFAVDAPGVRRVLKAGEEAAKKNLKIAGGLMSRHYHAAGRGDSSQSRRAPSAQSSPAGATASTARSASRRNRPA